MRLMRYPEARRFLRDELGLDIPECSLRNKVAKGLLPSLKPFGPRAATYLDADELIAFLRASRRGPEAPTGTATEG